MPALALAGGSAEPSDLDTEFSVEEIFFSTTDRKGIIRSCNRVFERVAGYTESELLGKAHNIVRHPDMPRAVFQLLWDTIGNGEPIAAYVKNQRKDGSAYWVIASVVPIRDGYLSVRLKPTSPLLAQVDELYKELRALELPIEAGEGRARERAIAASQARLLERLAELGFGSYEEFMRAALPAELAARDQVKRRSVEPAAGLGDPALAGILACTGRTGKWLDSIFGNLADYQTLNEGLAERSGFVSELSEAIGLFSMNALIKAIRLGSRAAGLGAVADLMGQRSSKIGTVLAQLTSDVQQTVELLAPISFGISLCRLQIEMASAFALELLDHTETDPAREMRLREDIAMLARKVADEVEELAAQLSALTRSLGNVRRGAMALTEELSILRALQMNGMIESAHLDDAGDVEALFRQIREQLNDASTASGDFIKLTRDRGADRTAVPLTLGRDLAELRELAGTLVARSQLAAAA